MKVIRILVGLAFTTILAACTGTSGGTKYAMSDGVAAEPGSPEEIICTYEKVMGSHFKSKSCMTRARRDRIRNETQRAMIDMKGHTSAQPGN